MKVPKIRQINDWFEIDEVLHIDFLMDVDHHNPHLTEDHARILNIEMTEVEQYVIDSDLLISYTDYWDYSSESVYQEYSEISFDEWCDSYLDDSFIREYIEYYIKYNGIPDLYLVE